MWVPWIAGMAAHVCAVGHHGTLWHLGNMLHRVAVAATTTRGSVAGMLAKVPSVSSMAAMAAMTAGEGVGAVGLERVLRVLVVRVAMEARRHELSSW